MSAAATLSHHWDVFKAALSMEKAREKSAQRYRETEFLPAALEIMETPPSPMARMLLIALSALVGVALIWSIIGKVDVVAVAPGKIIPAARVKIIQWGGTGGGSEGMAGVIRAINVVDGQEVKAGQVLLELDTTITGADAAQATRGLLSANIERAKARAMMAYLNGRQQKFIAPAGTPPEVAATQRSLIESTIAEYEAKRATLNEAESEKKSELAGALSEQEKLRETLPLLEQQVAARAELAEKGYGSKLLLWQIQEQLVERKKNVAIQQSNIARARAALASLTQQRAQLKQELARNSLTGLAEAEDDASLRLQEQAKAEQRQLLTKIVAPVDGTVTQLSTNTLGGVIQAAQPLMTIVPKNSALIVEAHIQNKDIGFIRKGQTVHVKLDAYPFTDYGIVDGVLSEISADAVPLDSNGQQSAGQAGEGGNPPAAGLTYTARITLDQASIAKVLARAGCSKVEPCLRKISPGMSVQAEIKTGKRRILKYLLSPIAKVSQEAGRER
jgi:hemolysin D